MDAIHKIKIKIGTAEFEAEGPTEVVQTQFNNFMEAISRLPQQPQNPATPPGGAGGLPTPPGIPIGDSRIPKEILDRVFRDGDPISLAARPTGPDGDVNGLIILVYALTHLKGAKTVTGVTLMKAAKQSGLKVPRVDRVIEGRSELILTAGVRRSRSYSLNNRGLEEAERLIKALVD